MPIYFKGDRMEEKFLLKQDQLNIPCKLTLPDSGPIRRVILGVHGFGGSMADDIQVSIAEEMEMFGAATLQFDFPCHGESPMDADSFTLHNCMNTLLTAASYAKERFEAVEDLCIFATGFGAYVTLICLHDLLEMPGGIRLVVQTPSVRMADTLLAMISKSAQTLRAEDRFTVPSERPFDVTYSFYKELQKHVALDSYPIPMLILQGEDDRFIRMEDIQNFHRINEASKLVIIPGASHRFLEPGAWDMVLDLTRDWFEFQQVLLSDWM